MHILDEVHTQKHLSLSCCANPCTWREKKILNAAQTIKSDRLLVSIVLNWKAIGSTAKRVLCDEQLTNKQSAIFGCYVLFLCIFFVVAVVVLFTWALDFVKSNGLSARGIAIVRNVYKHRDTYTRENNTYKCAHLYTSINGEPSEHFIREYEKSCREAAQRERLT